jgi:hypothetical protein
MLLVGFPAVCRSAAAAADIRRTGTPPYGFVNRTLLLSNLSPTPLPPSSLPCSFCRLRRSLTHSLTRCLSAPLSAFLSGGLFELVSGANFFGEILEWIGFAIAVRLSCVALSRGGGGGGVVVVVVVVAVVVQDDGSGLRAVACPSIHAATIPRDRMVATLTAGARGSGGVRDARRDSNYGADRRPRVVLHARVAGVLRGLRC